MTFIGKKLDAAKANGSPVQDDPRVGQFRVVIDRELEACSKIISDLPGFRRNRQPQRRPCPLRALVDESIELVPKRDNVTVVNSVPVDLPAPEIDKDQFRQVFVNLVQNASEAMPEGRSGRVEVRAEASRTAGWRIAVSDDGAGISPDVVTKIFQPLFSTKTKGTGLGLAIVHGTLERHGASVGVQTRPGEGTTFTIELPGEASGGSDVGRTLDANSGS